MARLILKCPYLKPDSKTQIATYVKYIATREGVEFVKEFSKYHPITEKQQRFIDSLLYQVPESRELLEYEDYVIKPNRLTAANFIETALELAEASEQTRDQYVKYIAERPGAEIISTHGLFTDEGEPVVLAHAVQEVSQSQSNVWGHIISLKREDAERLGYNSVDAWMQLLRSQRNYIAEQMNINPKNFRWYAAFHNEGHHPHVHMIAYSINPNEAYLSTEGIENIKSALAREIFRDERISIYKAQTQYRNEVKESSKVLVSDFIKEINSGVLDNPVIENMLIDLAQKISGFSGRLQYGYLPAYAKKIVNAIVDELEKDERIDKLYQLWYEKETEIISFYTDNYPERKPLSQNKEFKSIKNMIISEAMNVLLRLEDDAVTDEETESEPTLHELEMVKDSSGFRFDHGDYNNLIRQAENRNTWCQYKLAKYLMDKNNPEYNPEEAVKWFKAAAENRNYIAEYVLGKMYLKGEVIEQDVDEAVKWLNRSVKHKNPYAEYLLGKEYLKGDILPLDVVTGIELLESSADSGNKYACYTLGKALYEGKDCSPDKKRGLFLLEYSADEGFQYAQYYLGKLLYNNAETPEDLKKAVSYLSQAGRQNNHNALYLLGKILASDDVYDIEKAIRCYRLAAKHGNTFAEYQLGRIYLYGRGVDKDYYKAIEYLTLAASKGNQYAAQLLYSAERHRNAFAAIGGLSILKSIARAMQESINEQERRNRLAMQDESVDSKIRRKINEKKQAHGLKPNM